jgi:hypothetical protein
MADSHLPRLPGSTMENNVGLSPSAAGMGRCSNPNRWVGQLQSELPKPCNTTLAPGMHPISAAHSCSHLKPHRIKTDSTRVIVGRNQCASGAGRLAGHDGRFALAAHRVRRHSQRTSTSPERGEQRRFALIEPFGLWSSGAPERKCRARQGSWLNCASFDGAVGVLRVATSRPSRRTGAGTCPNRQSSTRASHQSDRPARLA